MNVFFLVQDHRNFTPQKLPVIWYIRAYAVLLNLDKNLFKVLVQCTIVYLLLIETIQSTLNQDIFV